MNGLVLSALWLLAATPILVANVSWAKPTAVKKETPLKIAERLLPTDPIAAFEAAQAAKADDERAVLLFAIDQAIAKRVNPVYEADNEFKVYVQKHRKRFTENSEPFQGSYRPSRLWIKKLKSKTKAQAMLAEYDYEELSIFADAALEGGANDADTRKLVTDKYSAWLKKYPRATHADEVKKRISELQQPASPPVDPAK